MKMTFQAWVAIGLLSSAFAAGQANAQSGAVNAICCKGDDTVRITVSRTHIVVKRN